MRDSTPSPLVSQLKGDLRGVTTLEFALVSPVFLMMIFGGFEFGHTVYLQAVLNGAVQSAGRNAGLESGASNLAAIDTAVRNQVANITPAGVIVTSRKNYANFTDIGKPEDFHDANGNNVHDATECFTDTNGNGTWDSDRSQDGLGGADDVVVYTTTVTYKRIVPLWRMMGWGETAKASATTTLRNQPFGDQAVRREVQVCP